jgi:deoxyuridine 5'-triphosphate nucleotidohydrolase
MIPQYRFALREDLKDDKRFLPIRATSRSTGWDVSCAFENGVKRMTIAPGEYVKIPLGIRCLPPEGYWFELKPRSSTFVKKKMHALYGTIDNDYNNFQLYFCAKYDGKEPLEIEFGEKIGQIIPVKVQEMEVIDVANDEFDKMCSEKTGERKGGFGSTDSKETNKCDDPIGAGGPTVESKGFIKYGETTEGEWLHGNGD